LALSSFLFVDYLKAESVSTFFEEERRATSAVYAKDLVSGKTLVAFNQDLPLKPASVQKLALSAAALEFLGPEYRWRTPVYLEGVRGGRAQVLSVVGTGDPSLTTESLWMMARAIKKQGISSIDRIVLDDSGYIETRARTGTNAYQGRPTALALNYNAFAIEVCPTIAGDVPRVLIDPLEYRLPFQNRAKTYRRSDAPLTIDEDEGCGSDKCAQRFSITGSVAEGGPCASEYRSVAHIREYFAQVFTAFLRQLGIGGTMAIEYAPVKAGITPTFFHQSDTLVEVLTGLNRFSTNVTADQVVYALGREREMSSYSRGMDRIRQYVKSFSFDPAVSLHDGSGLSHDNRLTAESIVAILDRQYTRTDIAAEFMSTLSVWGRSGTLKSRRAVRSSVTIRGKTGSLDGVSTLAGYILRDRKPPIAFAILQNRVASKQKAIDIESQVIARLIGS
jgi:D-alanyl-D-alanine carboxypeptidase/D-alanyl-D-alanine-endopeptidase (penicillin-binding protein 4)